MDDRNRYDLNTFAGRNRYRDVTDYGGLYGANRVGRRVGRNFYGGEYGADYFGRLRYRSAYDADHRNREIARRNGFYGAGWGGDSFNARRGFYGGATDVTRGYDAMDEYGLGGGMRGSVRGWRRRRGR